MEKDLQTVDLQKEQKNVIEAESLKTLIGKNISEYRKLANLSQLEFAEKLNYSDKAISKWERGESLPDVIVLKQIADLFGITVNDLIGQTTQKKKRSLSFKKLLQNKILVMLLSCGVVWLVATIVFVFFTMFNLLPNHAWLSFIYALPISFILCMIFTGRWKLKIPLMIFESLFVWTLALSVCLTVPYTNIWLLLIIGFPLQVLIIFWFFYQRQKSMPNR